ncbi:biliverdin-producing heme oxygenase [Corallococcus sp. M34]|uniref:biliverdin-producing heme oxygenase n=1 Tax=Citreicoccus inhibens TaxID=2849499 RepID=UPI001C21E5AC|nr:biliverdin-producing heme oxygenase [Citreicoccus inhibens]MBU8894202.1 biliverdin-producing heme oxygenase [Citreicoccus inhibens]
MTVTGVWRGPRPETSARERRLSVASQATGLATRLEEETVEARLRVERSLFLQSLFCEPWEGGVLGEYVRAAHYTAYLRQLHVLYSTFESLLPRLRDVPLAQVLWLPELRRASALEADLAWFCGDTRSEPFACEETLLHVERMREVLEAAPHLLLAHAYTRCVLDLYPGPLKAQLVAESFELEDGSGTAFYNALTLGEVPAFRARLHERLEALRLSEDAVEEIVQEARLAFRLHARLCESLARGGPAVVLAAPR